MSNAEIVRIFFFPFGRKCCVEHRFRLGTGPANQSTGLSLHKPVLLHQTENCSVFAHFRIQPNFAFADTLVSMVAHPSRSL